MVREASVRGEYRTWMSSVPLIWTTGKDFLFIAISLKEDLLECE